MDPVTAALELQPIIRKYLGKGEQEARLVNEVFAAVGQAGIFRLFAPHEVGGLEASPAVALAAIEAVSAADPAVGWCIGNSQPACLAVGWLRTNGRNSLPSHIATSASQRRQPARPLRKTAAIAFGYESSRNIQHSAGRVLLGGEPLDPLF